jgi:hypothetical protein
MQCTMSDEGKLTRIAEKREKLVQLGKYVHFNSSSLNSISLQIDAAQCCEIMHLALSREMLPVGVLVVSLSLRVSISYKSRRHSSIIHTSTLLLYCNVFAGSIFKMEVYYTPKFNTLQLITVHNSSRPLTQV